MWPKNQLLKKKKNETLANSKTGQWKSLNWSRKRKKNRIRKCKDRLRDLWNKQVHQYSDTGVTEGEGRAESLFDEIMAKNFPKLGKEIGI